MTPKRVFYGMIGLNLLLMVLIAVAVYFGNQMLSQQSSKLYEARLQEKVTDNQQVALAQAKKDVEKYSDINELTKSIVPQDKDQAKTVREINTIANEAGVKLKTISFQTSELGGQKAPDLTQVKPVEGIEGVYTLDITIASPENVQTTYDAFLKFLDGLEKKRRTAHVNQILITPNPVQNGINFTLTLQVYIKQ